MADHQIELNLQLQWKNGDSKYHGKYLRIEIKRLKCCLSICQPQNLLYYSLILCIFKILDYTVTSLEMSLNSRYSKTLKKKLSYSLLLHSSSAYQAIVSHSKCSFKGV